MQHRTKSNSSLVDEYQNHIDNNMGKLKHMASRIDGLGKSLEDSRRKTSLLCEMITIINQTLELQRKQAKLFPQPQDI
ncbi:MAG: hypothetical protein NXI25_20795 [bacterium]|uniref:hypothetical protein n=1 Tax=Phaeodactylibacter xiamenensis TaxID=1524460 RepID=UPI0024A833CD|nr:hypothetical protein [Phaeodactylibacter xiamenensis]MCR9102406.1 hypothetical protein [bacterium]